MLIINIFMNLLLNQFYKHILKRDFIELYEKQVYFEKVYCFYQSIMADVLGLMLQRRRRRLQRSYFYMSKKVKRYEV